MRKYQYRIECTRFMISRWRYFVYDSAVNKDDFNYFKRINYNQRVVYVTLLLVCVSTLLLFLPLFNLRIYSVYLYDLTRKEIAHHSLSIFDLAFGNDFYYSKPIILLFFLLPFLEIVFLLLYAKNNKLAFLILFLFCSIAFVITLSYSNTIFARLNHCKAYCYQKEFLSIAKTTTRIEPETSSHDVAYWIDLNIGAFLPIAFNGSSFALLFSYSFLLPKPMR